MDGDVKGARGCYVGVMCDVGLRRMEGERG